MFFRNDFYRRAEELAEQLNRVEAVWGDRFRPSWMIFIDAPTLRFRRLGGGRWAR